LRPANVCISRRFIGKPKASTRTSLGGLGVSADSITSCYKDDKKDKMKNSASESITQTPNLWDPTAVRV
jgi:hypothetical protein